ncbi:hypothetical protein [Pseudomonas akapageensis]|uniref:hypothetical protein n=1 Tax=Pseudomonas akapageensis TaxID=2609961 RepID=UPI00140E142E|nr:hypothetical protein [Pseudomonas akapageensis]
MSLTKPNRIPAAFTALFFAALTAGCTTQLTDKRAQVDLITTATDGCSVINHIIARGSSSTDALNIAFNQTASQGGDSFCLASINEVDSSYEIDGTSLKCRQKK